MTYRSMPIAVDAGGPGWKTRRNRVMRVTGLALAALLLLLSLVNLDEEPAGAGSSAAIAAFILVFAVPTRRPRGEPYSVVEDGRAMVAIPMRPITLRVALGLGAVGVMILVGAIVGAWRAIDGETLKAIAMLVFGGGLGATLAALGLANLLPATRKPRPILLSEDGVSWVFGGKRQHAPWEDIAAIEAWWTPIGFGIVRPITNHILLRGPDGEPVTAFRVSLLAIDPELALRTLHETHARSAHPAA